MEQHVPDFVRERQPIAAMTLASPFVNILPHNHLPLAGAEKRVFFPQFAALANPHYKPPAKPRKRGKK